MIWKNLILLTSAAVRFPYQPHPDPSKHFFGAEKPLSNHTRAPLGRDDSGKHQISNVEERPLSLGW